MLAMSTAMLLRSALFGVGSLVLLTVSVVGWFWPEGDAP